MVEQENKNKIPISFILKIVAVIVLVISFLLFEEEISARKRLNQVSDGLFAFLIPSIILSVSRFVVIALYNVQNANKSVRGNFVLGINRLTAILHAVFLIIAIMIAFGINPVNFVTSLTIVAMAIAVLFRDYITNLISGLFIMFSEQLSVGDRIKIGEHQGRIIDITFANIIIQNEEDDMVMVPNNLVFTSPTINLSAHRSNLFTVKFELPLHAATEIDKLENEVQAVILNHPNLAQDSDMILNVEEIGKDFVRYKIELHAVSSSNRLHKQLENELLRQILIFERALLKSS